MGNFCNLSHEDFPVKTNTPHTAIIISSAKSAVNNIRAALKNRRKGEQVFKVSTSLNAKIAAFTRDLSCPWHPGWEQREPTKPDTHNRSLESRDRNGAAALRCLRGVLRISGIVSLDVGELRHSRSSPRRDPPSRERWGQRARLSPHGCPRDAAHLAVSGTCTGNHRACDSCSGTASPAHPPGCLTATARVSKHCGLPTKGLRDVSRIPEGDGSEPWTDTALHTVSTASTAPRFGSCQPLLCRKAWLCSSPPAFSAALPSSPSPSCTLHPHFPHTPDYHAAMIVVLFPPAPGCLTISFLNAKFYFRPGVHWEFNRPFSLS